MLDGGLGEADGGNGALRRDYGMDGGCSMMDICGMVWCGYWWGVMDGNGGMWVVWRVWMVDGQWRCGWCVGLVNGVDYISGWRVWWLNR